MVVCVLAKLIMETVIQLNCISFYSFFSSPEICLIMLTLTHDSTWNLIISNSWMSPLSSNEIHFTFHNFVHSSINLAIFSYFCALMPSVVNEYALKLVLNKHFHFRKLSESCKKSSKYSKWFVYIRMSRKIIDESIDELMCFDFRILCIKQKSFRANWTKRKYWRWLSLIVSIIPFEIRSMDHSFYRSPDIFNIQRIQICLEIISMSDFFHIILWLLPSHRFNVGISDKALNWMLPLRQ